jgi:hypothetical protein
LYSQKDVSRKQSLSQKDVSRKQSLSQKDVSRKQSLTQKNVSRKQSLAQGPKVLGDHDKINEDNRYSLGRYYSHITLFIFMIFRRS